MLAGFPTTQAEAKGYQEAVAAFYPALYRWMNAVIWQAKETHYIETIGGHRRRLVSSDTDDWTAKSYGERQAVNAVVQGSAADILRRVMLLEPWPAGMQLIAQVHDELLWEYPKDPPNEPTLRVVQDLCETGHGFDLRVPLVFVPKVCEGWDEK
jgi:DNA polymerase-1